MGDTHSCPKAGCDAQLPSHVLACKTHWFELPPELRRAISKAWNEGSLSEHLVLREQAVALLNAPLGVDIREPEVQ